MEQVKSDMEQQEVKSDMELIDLLESFKNFKSKNKNDENTQANGKAFEEYIKERFVAFGYRDVSTLKRTIYKDLLASIRKCYYTENEIENVAKLTPRRILFQQPYGSQSPPDFFLVDIMESKIHFQPVEVKTGKKAATWNNNYPKNGWIYIFSGAAGVTYFMGKNLIASAVKELFDEYKMLRKAMTAEYNKKLADMAAGWHLIDYFKFEHTSAINYKADNKCDEREKEVADVLVQLMQLNI
jgi:hypothetical protein